jgi:hypothetical protein
MSTKTWQEVKFVIIPQSFWEDLKYHKQKVFPQF